MNDSYIVYGKKLEVLGDMLIKAANLFAVPDNFAQNISRNVVIDLLNNFNVAVERFEFISKELNSTVPPSIVNKEHQDIIIAVNKYIQGTKILISSIDLKALTVNEEEIERGQSIQKEGSVLSKTATDEMTKKFLESIK